MMKRFVFFGICAAVLALFAFASESAVAFPHSGHSSHHSYHGHHGHQGHHGYHRYHGCNRPVIHPPIVIRPYVYPSTYYRPYVTPLPYYRYSTPYYTPSCRHHY